MRVVNRRIALKNALLIAGGAALLPRSLRGEKDASIALEHLAMTSADEQLLASIVETLIPETDTPGARELNVHLFVLKMVDDCHSPEEQRRFAAGLSQVNAFAKRQTGKEFMDCSEADKKRVLEALNRSGVQPGELASFNRQMRRRAIQGYKESRYVMTQLKVHRMIPEPYEGYFPASEYEA